MQHKYDGQNLFAFQLRAGGTLRKLLLRLFCIRKIMYEGVPYLVVSLVLEREPQTISDLHVSITLIFFLSEISVLTYIYYVL